LLAAPQPVSKPPRRLGDADSALVPRLYDRRGRVELIAEAAQVLLASGTEAGLFTGGALLAWLENGGDLERDYLQVTAKAGSHHTPTVIWQTSSRGATDPKSTDTLAPSTSKARPK
jgi:hypothetical protein